MIVAPEPLAISIARATLLGSFTVAGDRHRVAAGGHLDVLVGHELLEEALEPGRVGRHLDRVDPHLAGVVPDQEGGRAQPLAVDQDLGRREHDGLGDGRIAHGESRDRDRVHQQRRGALGDRDHPLGLGDDSLRPSRPGRGKDEQGEAQSGTSRVTRGSRDSYRGGGMTRTSATCGRHRDTPRSTVWLGCGAAAATGARSGSRDFRAGNGRPMGPPSSALTWVPNVLMCMVSIELRSAS